MRVDLVAAVHIADKSYYQELNKRFAGYDAVLYELVAPEGTRIPQGGRKDKRAGNMLSAVQLGMKDLLKLEFQLDQVDYTRKNLVHADLSPEQFVKSMRDRKEGFTDIFTRLLAYALAKQAQGGDGGEMQLLMAMFDKNRSLALKRAMADQFQEMEGMTAVFEGPKGSTLIGERNKRALEVLKKQIAAGKKKIAIFYGAGHMADMEKRLRADFSLQPQADPVAAGLGYEVSPDSLGNPLERAVEPSRQSCSLPPAIGGMPELTTGSRRSRGREDSKAPSAAYRPPICPP